VTYVYLTYRGWHENNVSESYAGKSHGQERQNFKAVLKIR